MVFHAEHIAVNHLQNTLSSCAKVGCFSVCYLRRPFILSVDTIKDCNWSHFLFHKHWMIKCYMKDNHTLVVKTFASKLFHVSEGLVMLHVSCCQQYIFYSYRDLLKLMTPYFWSWDCFLEVPNCQDYQ